MQRFKCFRIYRARSNAFTRFSGAQMKLSWNIRDQQLSVISPLFLLNQMKICPKKQWRLCWDQFSFGIAEIWVSCCQLFLEILIQLPFGGSENSGRQASSPVVPFLCIYADNILFTFFAFFSLIKTKYAKKSERIAILALSQLPDRPFYSLKASISFVRCS